MKKLSLIVVPISIVLIYVIFGVNYYSVTTSILFFLYFLYLFILGGINIKVKTIIFGIVVLAVLFLQWYSIDLTLDWLDEMNNNPIWSFGTDFLVVISWISLLSVTSVLNYRAYKGINS